MSLLQAEKWRIRLLPNEVVVHSGVQDYIGQMQTEPRLWSLLTNGNRETRKLILQIPALPTL